MAQGLLYPGGTDDLHQKRIDVELDQVRVANRRLSSRDLTETRAGGCFFWIQNPSIIHQNPRISYRSVQAIFGTFWKKYIYIYIMDLYIYILYGYIYIYIYTYIYIYMWIFEVKKLWTTSHIFWDLWENHDISGMKEWKDGRTHWLWAELISVTRWNYIPNKDGSGEKKWGWTKKGTVVTSNVRLG